MNQFINDPEQRISTFLIWKKKRLIMR